ncbi:MAG: threonine synthase [Calditrichaeota bacterium]|nr:MAG: threonine synthase [Calditrichota bacterium]
MLFYSTKNRSHKVSLEEAVRRGMPPDKGLYMPEMLPRLSQAFFNDLPRLSLRDIAVQVASVFLRDVLTEQAIKEVVEDSITFETPLVRLEKGLHVLELFHGPTLAFKDVGARFMARLMARLHPRGEMLHILVATSGDTGSAVAHGFYNVPGVRVILLYPAGRVSPLQEKQMTTLGGNIIALEVDGVFDDCQRLVKSAFADESLNARMALSSANSINIARLLPQSFYYFYAVGQMMRIGETPPVIAVPSGNFGNLTAGLLAQRMGLPVRRFIAAVNANAVFPAFLRDGVFRPAPSVATLSNAMDVGNPSNLGRIIDLFGSDMETLRRHIYSASFSDALTREAIGEIYRRYGYVADPHGAVGWLGVRHYRRTSGDEHPALFLETAHPAKFAPTVEKEIGQNVHLPERLQACLERSVKSRPISAEYDDFKHFLLHIPA